MAMYGGFETIEQLRRNGRVTVWSACASGRSGAAAYVVRVHEPRANASAAEAQNDGARLLATAVVQARAAENGGLHWAPIVTSGWCERSAYVVLPRYARTLDQVVQDKRRLSAADLHALAGAILEGLTELNDTCQRGHGNLKPSNVFLAGPGDLARAQVLLSDVAPAAPADASKDLRAIGAILYELVMHQAAPPQCPQELPAGKEWSRLGAHGEQWRQLVGGLLGAPSTVLPTSLPQLTEQLEQLRPGRRPLVGALVVALVLSLVAGGVSWGLWSSTKVNVQTVPALEWVELGVWSHNALAALADTDEATWSGWAARDPALAELHRRFQEATKRRIAVVRKIPATDLVADPQVAKAAAVQRTGAVGAIEASPRWAAALTEARLKLAESSSLCRQTWAAHQAASDMMVVLEHQFPEELRTTAAAYRARGWNQAASSLTALADSVGKSARGLSPRPQGLSLSWQIEQVLAAKAAVAGLEEPYALLQHLEDTIAASEEKGTLSKFAEVVASDLRQADGPASDQFYRDMAGRIARADEVARGLLPYVEHWRTHTLHEVVAAWKAPEPLSLATYETHWPQAVLSPWATRAENDPRTSQWSQSVASLQVAIEQGLDRLKRLEDRDGFEAMQARYAQLATTTAHICGRPASVESVPSIAAQAAGALADFETLKTDVDKRIAWNSLPPESHPLATWDWQSQTKRVLQAIDQLPRSSNAEELRQRLLSIVAVLERQRPQEQPWTRARQGSIESAVASARAQLAALTAQVGGEATLRPAEPAAGSDGPDPRSAAWSSAVADGRQRVADCIAQLRGAYEDPAAAERHEARLVIVDEQVRQVTDKGLTWTRGNQRRIVDGTALVAGTLAQLEQDLAGQLAASRSRLVARLARRSWSSPALEHWWNRQIAATEQASLPISTFLSRAGTLADLAAQLDALPASVETVPAGSKARVADRIMAHREETVIQALAAVRYMPGGDAASIPDKAAWEKPQKAYLQWHAQARALLADMKALDDRLSLGSGLEAPAVQELASKTGSHPRYRELAADMPELASAVKQLERISSGKLGVEELAAIGEDPTSHVAVALAAWRKLSAAGGVSEPYRRKTVQLTLQSLVRIHVADQERRQALLNELASWKTVKPAEQTASVAAPAYSFTNIAVPNP